VYGKIALALTLPAFLFHFLNPGGSPIGTISKLSLISGPSFLPFQEILIPVLFSDPHYHPYDKTFSPSSPRSDSLRLACPTNHPQNLRPFPHKFPSLSEAFLPILALSCTSGRITCKFNPTTPLSVSLPSPLRPLLPYGFPRPQLQPLLPVFHERDNLGPPGIILDSPHCQRKSPENSGRQGGRYPTSLFSLGLLLLLSHSLPYRGERRLPLSPTYDIWRPPTLHTYSSFIPRKNSCVFRQSFSLLRLPPLLSPLRSLPESY